MVDYHIKIKKLERIPSLIESNIDIDIMNHKLIIYLIHGNIIIKSNYIEDNPLIGLNRTIQQWKKELNNNNNSYTIEYI